jgi:hypothetical protein
MASGSTVFNYQNEFLPDVRGKFFCNFTVIPSIERTKNLDPVLMREHFISILLHTHTHT